MNGEATAASWHGDVVDAYAHIGRTKYGSLPDTVRFFSRLDIREGVFVLGPGTSDLHSLTLESEKPYAIGCFTLACPLVTPNSQISTREMPADCSFPSRRRK